MGTQTQLTVEQLTAAFDLTLATWASALDLRDQEPAGHAQRVAETAVGLARAMNLGEEELVHMRRGALLHDIGKMVIPDSILLKPGSLSAEEWEVVRQHPLFAYRLLQAVDLLLPALDIPYCHHEKWDGTGYPRGLKGEEIPLAARIFSIIDVREALLSKRPYRPSWQPELVDTFIESLAGTHFDPQVVAAYKRTVPPAAPA
jgi:HD-GYP domain-containing protein (c-di-GMP phosphodiesterase class II)